MTDNRDLFTDEHAERLKPHTGKPYRPCNGFEGDLFMSRWCVHCTKDNIEDGDGCEIIALTMALDEDDEDYPKAWQFSSAGQPLCTEFEAQQGAEDA